MITIQVRILTLAAAILFGALAGVDATAPVDACSPPYQEGKHYAIGDWVSAPSSIIAASAATGDNRISCSPPGVDGCPQTGFFNVVHRSDAHSQKYNYQCNSLDTLCSDDNYAPGTIFSGMAWSMMGIDPCSVSAKTQHIRVGNYPWKLNSKLWLQLLRLLLGRADKHCIRTRE